MPRPPRRPRPTYTQSLTPLHTYCPECGQPFRIDYTNTRSVTTLRAVTCLTLHIRRCQNPACERYHRPSRPEAEPSFALPHHEFGLDVLALVGRLRYAEHRSLPEIHRELTRRGVVAALRTVTNLLARYHATSGRGPAPRQTPSGSGRCCARSAASCWPSTACSPTSATRSSGSCATAS